MARPSAGAPIAAATALAAMDVIDDPELLRRTRELGAAFMERLGRVGRHRRGSGSRADGRGHPCEGLEAADAAARALEEGLVINVPGPGHASVPATPDDRLRRASTRRAEILARVLD